MVNRRHRWNWHPYVASHHEYSLLQRGLIWLANFLGTPTYLVGQTVFVAIWIAVNIAAVAYRWDPYPFILLNLAFSTQAAYAAPIILYSQNRGEAQREGVARRQNEMVTELHEHSQEARETLGAMSAKLDVIAAQTKKP